MAVDILSKQISQKTGNKHTAVTLTVTQALEKQKSFPFCGKAFLTKKSLFAICFCSFLLYFFKSILDLTIFF